MAGGNHIFKSMKVSKEADKRFVQKHLDMGLDKTEAAYASMVEGMDKSLGDLMTFVKEKGLADNTTILFMSDNGGLSAHARGGEPHTHNRPLASGKGSAYEGGIREPMIVKWPGTVEPSSICDQYVIIEDFFTSVLQMADIKNQATVQYIDGESFVPLLKGKEAARDTTRTLIWHYPNRWGGHGPGIGTTSTIRKGDWKLIYWYKDQSKELYNIKKDIGEYHDLSEQYPQKVDELSKALGKYLRSVDAQRPSFKNSGELVPWPDEI
jgi:arylsulfatase A-like enzyme